MAYKRYKDPDARRRYERAYYAADPARQRRYQKKYDAAHADAVRAQERGYRQRYRVARREDLIAARRAHPEWAAVHNANRLARRAGAFGALISADVRDAWAADPGCRYCGADAYGLDHVVPLSRGGANDRSNIVRCCPSCNRLKGARTPEEWRLATAPLVEPVQEHERRGHDREGE